MRQNYPEITLQEILDQYPDLGRISDFQLFTSGYENSNYFVSTDTGQFVIKIFEGMSVTPENILFELEVMDECQKRGLKTPRIFRNKSHELATMINGKYAMLMNFIEGENMHQKPLSDELVKETAIEAGKMDKALKMFRDGSKARQNYEFDIKNSILLEKSIKLLSKNFDHEIFANILRGFRQIKPTLDSSPTGIIHNDIVPHNLLVKKGKLQAIIDFSDMVWSSYIQNIAVSLHLVAFGYNWQPKQAKLFLESYRRYNPISEKETGVLHELILARFASFIIEFNRWNLEFGEDKQRTETIRDQYEFLQRFLALGRAGFTKLLK